ncbi:MAG: chemotaxis protein CheR [Rhodocyclaceae bacterium]|nr:chemotaxis protein CheR [Rhodocyclaceae bacterium]
MLKLPDVNPRSQAPREFEYSMADFERIRALIYRHAGISLAPIKQDMVYSRLARRLRALRLNTFSAYLDYLEKADETEWETFVNSLTTNLTSFFREAHHFDILNRFLNAQPHRPLTIWCSAASTGEEPYSLAITACETFGTLTPPVSIIASDIDTNVLAKGEAGVYPVDRVEKMSQERLRQFFLRGTGNQEGLVRVRPELRKLISFTRINLLEPRWPQIPSNLDVIFCRNVMIYFDKPTQHQILKRFAPMLREDGLLFAGHSESFLHAADVFRPLGRTVYERADRRGAPRKGLF